MRINKKERKDMKLVSNKRKSNIFPCIIGIIAILYGVVGIFEYAGSMMSFLKDPFYWSRTMSYKLPRDDKLQILIFLNLNLFIALISYILFIFSGMAILKKKQTGEKILFFTSLIYFLFFILHDFFFLPITLDSIKAVFASESSILFIRNLFDDFGYIFFGLFFIISSCFIKFEKEKKF